MHQKQYQHHANERNESGRTPNVDVGWNFLLVTRYPVSRQQHHNGYPI
jgi:hypothetical protein